MTMKQLRESLKKKGYEYTLKGWTYKGAGPINPRQIAHKLDMEYTTLLAVQQSLLLIKKGE